MSLDRVDDEIALTAAELAVFVERLTRLEEFRRTNNIPTIMELRDDDGERYFVNRDPNCRLHALNYFTKFMRELLENIAVSTSDGRATTIDIKQIHDVSINEITKLGARLGTKEVGSGQWHELQSELITASFVAHEIEGIWRMLFNDIVADREPNGMLQAAVAQFFESLKPSNLAKIAEDKTHKGGVEYLEYRLNADLALHQFPTYSMQAAAGVDLLLLYTAEAGRSAKPEYMTKILQLLDSAIMATARTFAEGGTLTEIADNIRRGECKELKQPIDLMKQILRCVGKECMAGEINADFQRMTATIGRELHEIQVATGAIAKTIF